MLPYQRFIFDTVRYEPSTGQIALRYALDDAVTFEEILTLPTQLRPASIGRTLQAALDALHLAGGVSYYKTCCPKTIELRSQNLDAQQVEFWNTVYEKGLGQFFFEHQMDFRNLIRFPAAIHVPSARPHTRAPRNPRNILVPVGGGKDSVVTIELLKTAGYDVTLLRVGGHPLIDAMATIAGLPLLTIDRKLPKALFDLNARGALNGHVPITAYLSFLAVVVAEIGEFDAVVWSNERSASEGNTEYLGSEINHQWSKSREFERMFQAYVDRWIGSDVPSFSLLRPWSELRVVQEFVKHPEYFPVTTSCNANWRLHASSSQLPAGRWCGRCPKCAFVYALCAAFLSREDLRAIFGAVDPFAEADNLPLYRQLLGLEQWKPFECVGTAEETRAAFLLSHQRGAHETSPAIMMFADDVLPSIHDGHALIARALATGSDHSIPEQLHALLIPHNP